MKNWTQHGSHHSVDKFVTEENELTQTAAYILKVQNKAWGLGIWYLTNEAQCDLVLSHQLTACYITFCGAVFPVMMCFKGYSDYWSEKKCTLQKRPEELR